MKTRHLLTYAVLGASAALTACSGSSSGGSKSALEKFVNSFTQEPGVAACGDIGKLLTTDTLLVGGINKNQCTLPPRIGSDVTLTNDIIWIANSKVKVGFGDFELEAGDKTALLNNPVTLTIEAGTEIRSLAGGAIVITRGSQIDVQGTAADPVIMSSLEQVSGGAAENYDGSGEWGGLVIQGFGKHNKCPNNSTDEICNILGEGDVGYFGGNDNTDSSGTINYLVIAEGGETVAPDNEINGATFQGVGSGTTVDGLQVINNADDGVEFFGGAPNVKHLLLVNNQDDSIDWDEGFRGNIQYALVVVDGTGDHGIESDNNGSSMDADPRSNPTLANITFVSTNSSAVVKHREGTGAYIYNSIVTSSGGACLDVDHAATYALVDTNLIWTNVFLDCTSDLQGDVEVAGVDYGSGVVDSAVGSVSSETVTLDADYAEDAAFANTLTMSYALSTTADTGFMDVTDYAGAVENGVTPWWDGWALTW